MLAQRATTVTAVDGAPEMLREAAASDPGETVTFVQADLYGEDSPFILHESELAGGGYRIVKMPHTSAGLPSGWTGWGGALR
jgi:hypothetical protein